MRVLVVEDNGLLRHHLSVQMREMGHQVDAAEDAKEADYFLQEHAPDIAIVDLGLPGEDGLSLIRRWRAPDQAADPGADRPRKLAGQSGGAGSRRRRLCNQTVPPKK